MLTDEQISEIEQRLTHQPFLCDHVYFFIAIDNQINPLREEDRRLSDQHLALLQKLLVEPFKDVPGSIVPSPRQEGIAKFYAGIRLDALFVVVSKRVHGVESAPVTSPFDSYFLSALVATVQGVVGVKIASASPPPPAGERLYEFTELAAWHACKERWRAKYGADQWIAIKGSQPVAHAASQAELETAVQKLNLEPPVLYAPPEGQESHVDVLHSSFD